jgi:FtsZ-binding cell division protein ZapB
MTDGTDAGVRYCFVVARKNPDILARVQERLSGDPRIEVIADRRYGERRLIPGSPSPERRTRDRRRPTNIWNDLTIYPTLVAQRHVDSYAELEQKLASALRDAGTLAAENERQRESVRSLEGRIEALAAGYERLRAENARLGDEVAERQRRLEALASADAQLKTDVGALLGQAEHALGGLIEKFQRLVPEDRAPQKEPRLRSL